jgi:hypothetical protein
MPLHAQTRSTVLLACTPQSRARLYPLLAGIADVVTASTLEEALQRLAAGPALIVCSMKFDDSRMLDLAAEASRRYPHIPFVCCRASESELPSASLRGARRRVEPWVSWSSSIFSKRPASWDLSTRPISSGNASRGTWESRRLRGLALGSLRPHLRLQAPPLDDSTRMRGGKPLPHPARHFARAGLTIGPLSDRSGHVLAFDATRRESFRIRS